ncbi:MAG: hypothetical protein ABI207_05605 [Crocinitomicaceae bacterium]
MNTKLLIIILLYSSVLFGQNPTGFDIKKELINEYLISLDNSTFNLSDTILLNESNDLKLQRIQTKVVLFTYWYATSHKHNNYLDMHLDFYLVNDTTAHVTIQLLSMKVKKKLFSKKGQGPSLIYSPLDTTKNFVAEYDIKFDCLLCKWVKYTKKSRYIEN